jgi:hypothetical protein
MKEHLFGSREWFYSLGESDESLPPAMRFILKHIDHSAVAFSLLVIFVVMVRDVGFLRSLAIIVLLAIGYSIVWWLAKLVGFICRNWAADEKRSKWQVFLVDNRYVVICATITCAPFLILGFSYFLAIVIVFGTFYVIYYVIRAMFCWIFKKLLERSMVFRFIFGLLFYKVARYFFYLPFIGFWASIAYALVSHGRLDYDFFKLFYGY